MIPGLSIGGSLVSKLFYSPGRFPPREDAWVTASSLIGETSQMRFLVAVRPGLISPTLAARMAATFDRLSNGRILINVVTGGDPVELAGDGVFQSHDERYEITDDFLTIWRALLSSQSEVNFG